MVVRKLKKENTLQYWTTRDKKGIFLFYRYQSYLLGGSGNFLYENSKQIVRIKIWPLFEEHGKIISKLQWLVHNEMSITLLNQKKQGESQWTIFLVKMQGESILLIDH